MNSPYSLLSRYRSGVTMVEIVIVVVVLAILTLVIVPRVTGLVPAASDRSAITRAEALNNGMFTYRQRIVGAQTNWTAATTDDAKYLLLFGAGYMPNSASTLPLFAPASYTLAFPANLTGRVTVTGPSGAIAY